MSLSLLPLSVDVVQNLEQAFVASGGTPPYVYSVSGRGSINASTGVYTASPNSGSAIVKVVDAANASVTTTITVHTALTLFCRIIATEMGLDPDQCFLWDQKINIPPDERLYIAVGVLSCKPYGNRNFIDYSGAGAIEDQSTNFHATLDLNIFSRNSDARDRKEEVIMALKSVYAQQQQDEFAFKIGELSTAFTNLSSIEGAAIPYRFHVSISIQYMVKKAKSVDYYDTFVDAEIDVNA